MAGGAFGSAWQRHTEQWACGGPWLQVGDGTTSVIILAGEMLAAAEPFLERNLHPTTIIRCQGGRGPSWGGT